jgi:hypothetical protein
MGIGFILGDYFARLSGVDVMITIFGEKNWRFSNNQCYDPIFA